MNAQIILTAVGLLLGLIGTLGIAYAVFRSATVQKTLDLYKGENEALGKAVARQQADIVTLTTKVEELEKANAVLRDTVSGTAAVETLKRQMAEEHNTVVDILTEIKDQMAELWRGVIRLLGDRPV